MKFLRFLDERDLKRQRTRRCPRIIGLLPLKSIRLRKFLDVYMKIESTERTRCVSVNVLVTNLNLKRKLRFFIKIHFWIKFTNNEISTAIHHLFQNHKIHQEVFKSFRLKLIVELIIIHS